MRIFLIIFLISFGSGSTLAQSGISLITKKKSENCLGDDCLGDYVALNDVEGNIKWLQFELYEEIKPKGFVLIKSGYFKMGGSREDEQPIHQVHISQSFYLLDHEVTVEEYRHFDPKAKNENCSSDDCPVVHVSWDDVQAYIKWLNEKAGSNVYRLPTESEWEYAARAGTTTEYLCGNQASCLGKYAWYTETTHSTGAKPVKTKSSNNWKLYGMSGNVWEWVSDWYEKGYPAGPVKDPQGPRSGDRRVVRGGGWFDEKSDLRLAYRDSYPSDKRFDDLGFRLIKIR